MKRAIFLAVVLAGLFVANNVVGNVINPEVQTSTALEQAADPSIQTDSFRRSWNSVDFLALSIGGFVLLTVALYSNEIMDLVSKETEE